MPDKHTRKKVPKKRAPLIQDLESWLWGKNNLDGDKKPTRSDKNAYDYLQETGSRNVFLCKKQNRKAVQSLLENYNSNITESDQKISCKKHAGISDGMALQLLGREAWQQRYRDVLINYLMPELEQLNEDGLLKDENYEYLVGFLKGENDDSDPHPHPPEVLDILDKFENHFNPYVKQLFKTLPTLKDNLSEDEYKNFLNVKTNTYLIKLELKKTIMEQIQYRFQKMAKWFKVKPRREDNSSANRMQHRERLLNTSIFEALLNKQPSKKASNRHKKRLSAKRNKLIHWEFNIFKGYHSTQLATISHAIDHNAIKDNKPLN